LLFLQLSLCPLVGKAACLCRQIITVIIKKKLGIQGTKKS
jgi:hypothetical protein